VPTDQPPPIIFVRLRRGIVGESKRTVHVVPLPTEADEIPDKLTAYCGEDFEPGTIERLDQPTGMPCVRCLMLAPLPNAPTLPSAFDADPPDPH
jgi:hypothetical protein